VRLLGQPLGHNTNSDKNGFDISYLEGQLAEGVGFEITVRRLPPISRCYRR
jgi:hypothetical protein